MTTRKTPRNTKQLTATQAADKIATELGTFEDRVLEKIQAIQAVEKQASKDRIAAIMLRVAEIERDKVAKVLIALGCDLGGIELGAANDSLSSDVQSDVNEGIASDAASRLGPAGPVEPTERIERDEAGARRVGKGRA
jgi:hypothetical protein